MDSIDRIEASAPQRLRLTHFGVAEDVGAQLERARESLAAQAEAASGGDRERFLELLDWRIDAGTDPETARSLRQASPPDQLWQGLERYWRKRAEAEAPPESRIWHGVKFRARSSCASGVLRGVQRLRCAST